MSETRHRPRPARKLQATRYTVHLRSTCCSSTGMAPAACPGYGKMGTTTLFIANPSGLSSHSQEMGFHLWGLPPATPLAVTDWWPPFSHHHFRSPRGGAEGPARRTALTGPNSIKTTGATGALASSHSGSNSPGPGKTGTGGERRSGSLPDWQPGLRSAPRRQRRPEPGFIRRLAGMRGRLIRCLRENPSPLLPWNPSY